MSSLANGVQHVLVIPFKLGAIFRREFLIEITIRADVLEFLIIIDVKELLLFVPCYWLHFINLGIHANGAYLLRIFWL